MSVRLLLLGLGVIAVAMLVAAPRVDAMRVKILGLNCAQHSRAAAYALVKVTQAGSITCAGRQVTASERLKL